VFVQVARDCGSAGFLTLLCYRFLSFSPVNLTGTLGPSHQKITYEDFLPALIGHKLQPYSGYVITADPRISVEFATAGFPLELSMTPNIVEFLDKDGIMHHSPGPAQALSEDQLLGATTLVERGAIEPLLK
jgi:hypothetical protein